MLFKSMETSCFLSHLRHHAFKLFEKSCVYNMRDIVRLKTFDTSCFLRHFGHRAFSYILDIVLFKTFDTSCFLRNLRHRAL